MKKSELFSVHNCIPLKYELNVSCREVAMAIIAHDRWRESLRNIPESSITEGGMIEDEDTPFWKLIAKMPGKCHMPFGMLLKVLGAQNVTVFGLHLQMLPLKFSTNVLLPRQTQNLSLIMSLWRS